MKAVFSKKIKAGGKSMKRVYERVKIEIVKMEVWADEQEAV